MRREYLPDGLEFLQFVEAALSSSSRSSRRSGDSPAARFVGIDAETARNVPHWHARADVAATYCFLLPEEITRGNAEGESPGGESPGDDSSPILK